MARDATPLDLRGNFRFYPHLLGAAMKAAREAAASTFMWKSAEKGGLDMACRQAKGKSHLRSMHLLHGDFARLQDVSRAAGGSACFPFGKLFATAQGANIFHRDGRHPARLETEIVKRSDRVKARRPASSNAPAWLNRSAWPRTSSTATRSPRPFDMDYSVILHKVERTLTEIDPLRLFDQALARRGSLASVGSDVLLRHRGIDNGAGKIDRLRPPPRRAPEAKHSTGLRPCADARSSTTDPVEDQCSIFLAAVDTARRRTSVFEDMQPRHQAVRQMAGAVRINAAHPVRQKLPVNLIRQNDLLVAHVEDLVQRERNISC